MTINDPIVNKQLEPLRVYFNDNIKEIIMNKPQEILIEKASGEWETKEDKNLTLGWFRDFAKIMASYSGQKFDYSTPLLSFKLPEGHRVQIIYGDSYTKASMLLSIRLFRNKNFTLDDYVITKEDKLAIINSVKNKQTIIVAGGTGTGKTSFLNTILSYVEKDCRIITLEGVPELKINHNNWASIYYSENKTACGNKDISELLNTTLRMRPDRIIFGELRKENCFTFVRAINTGHSGSMATIHANSPEDVISAIKENIIMNGDAVEGALNILDKQLRKSIHGVIQLQRYENKIKGYFTEFRESMK